MENSQPPPESDSYKGGLKRLAPAAYQGQNWIHWTMTIHDRERGWLSPLSHSRIREALLHSLSRHDLICAVYCLMPDHGHFLIGGLQPEPASDQRLAIALFRKEWTRQLNLMGGDFKLQKQAHDHLLRKSEHAQKSAFEAVSGYLLENPVRSGLAEHFKNWDFLGALVPGYPNLDPKDEDFWDRFWKIYYKRLKDGGMK